MKIETPVLEALARLKSSEPRLVEWLEQRAQRHIIQMVNQTDDVAMRMAQGRVQEVTEILDIIKDAGNILRKVDR